MSTRHRLSGRLSLCAAMGWACAVALAVGACGAPDAAAGPESIAVTASRGAGTPTATPHTPGLDTAPHVRWDRRGETIALTLYGSGSCPTVPTRLESDPPAGRITVTISHDYDGPCTADFSPYTSIVKLEESMDLRRPIVLILKRKDQPDRRFQL